MISFEKTKVNKIDPETVTIIERVQVMLKDQPSSMRYGYGLWKTYISSFLVISYIKFINSMSTGVKLRMFVCTRRKVKGIKRSYYTLR